MANKTELLRQIKEEVLALKESPLYKERITNRVFPVIGEGNHEAQIMLVGEAPGKNEAATGRPFCGAAGKLLTQMVESISLRREDVYVTNIVKDRPPDNRDPFPEEIKLYAPFLDRQVEIIQPKIIATLGRFSMAYIMEKFGLLYELKSISQIHGKVFDVPIAKRYGIPHTTEGGIGTKGCPEKIITLYHPAVALYNGNMREQMFKDFQTVKQVLVL